MVSWGARAPPRRFATSLPRIAFGERRPSHDAGRSTLCATSRQRSRSPPGDAGEARRVAQRSGEGACNAPRKLRQQERFLPFLAAVAVVTNWSLSDPTFYRWRRAIPSAGSEPARGAPLGANMRGAKSLVYAALPGVLFL